MQLGTEQGAVGRACAFPRSNLLPVLSRRCLRRQEGIPFFIRWLLFRQAAKHEKQVWQPFERECLPAASA